MQIERDEWQRIYRRPIPWPSSPDILVLSAILRFTLFSERVRELFSQRLGLRTFELWTLYALAVLEQCRPPKPMPVSEIASILKMAPRANPSEVVGRLRAARLVQTKIDPKDRRHAVVVLTPKGRTLAKKILVDYEDLASEVLMGADRNAIPIVLKFLRTTLSNLEGIYSRPDPSW